MTTSAQQEGLGGGPGFGAGGPAVATPLRPALT